MALATYSDLQTSIANFSHRSDLTVIIPDLITLAEIRINGDIDARLQDVKTTIATVASTEAVALPSDVINIRTLTVASTTPIVVLDYYAPDAYESQYPYQETGTPQIYTVIGGQAYLSPIPDSVYTLNIVYKGRIPALSVSNTTNYILTAYPKVYLAASMCEVANYTKNPALAQIWEPQYADAVRSVNHQDWFQGSTMRVRTDVRG